MIARNLCIFALLVAFASATIDCSHENTCFGEPMDCNPDTSCKTLFRFDEQGNLDLYLHNFTEQMGYAAFPIKKHVNGTLKIYEYFLCIPHKGQVLRAFAELGKQVLITEQNFTGVDQLDIQDFRCQFNVAKMSKKFQQSHEFSVSIGIFSVPLVIANGVQLHNVKSHSEDDIPSTHYIGGSLDSDLPTEFIFTPEDGKALTEAIQEMKFLSETEEEDVEMEKLAKKVDNTRHVPESRDEEESSEDENTPRRRDYKETRQSTKGQKVKSSSSHEDEDEDRNTNTRRSDGRRQQKPNSRVPSRSDEDEDQEVDEYTPRRRDNSRRRDSEDSRRNTKSRDTDEDEESEDEYTPRRRDTKRGRPSRYEEDLEEEEDEEYVPKRKSKNRRHNKYDDEDLENDDESPKRRSTRKDTKNRDDEEDYESEDDEDEYDDNNASKINIVYIVILFVVHGLH